MQHRKASWRRRHLRGLKSPSRIFRWASLVAQLVNNPPAMQETWVLSLGWEDALEKGTTHSSVLAWRIPWPVRQSGRALQVEGTAQAHKQAFGE